MKTTNVPPSGSLRWRTWIGLALLWAGSAYFWIGPILRPRGIWLWGHYSFPDVYLGLPVGLITVCATLAALVPARLRRPLALRLTVMCVTLIVSIVTVDLFYSLLVMGAWQSNYWLDQAHIDRRYSMDDAELGFIRKPSIRWSGYAPGANRVVEYRTDKHGFRNPPDMSRADIVFIGDSYTEAAGVKESETFVQRVAAEAGVTAVNLGRGAYGPQQELIVLQRYGLSYQPRVVIWQLFEGNDLDDAYNFVEWKRNPQRPPTSILNRYRDNSLIQSILDRAPKSLPGESGYPHATLRYHDRGAKQVVIRYPYDKHQTEEARLGFAETIKAIEAGYRLCQSRGIRLVVVYVPIMVRVMEPWLDFASPEDRQTALPGYSLMAPLNFGNELAVFCQQLGCTYLDLYVPLRRRADRDNRRLYIPDDEHLDTQGHEVVAEAVKQLLVD